MRDPCKAYIPAMTSSCRQPEKPLNSNRGIEENEREMLFAAAHVKA
jgi:hypothetical protein